MYEVSHTARCVVVGLAEMVGNYLTGQLLESLTHLGGRVQEGGGGQTRAVLPARGEGFCKMTNVEIINKNWSELTRNTYLYS